MKGKEINMLCITMKRGEYFTVDGETVILFEQLSGERAHLTIHAPPERGDRTRCGAGAQWKSAAPLSGQAARTKKGSYRPEAIYRWNDQRGRAVYTTAHDEQAIPQLLESNLTLGTCLLEGMSAVGCRRLVYATTVTTHCTGAEYRPLTLYAATKQAFSDLVEFYTSSGLLSAAAVMISDTYGPGDLRPKVLNLIRRAALAQTPLDLTSGRQLYDAVYIDDAVQGFMQAAAALDGGPGHHFFQLFHEAPRSLRDTAALMLQVNNIAPELNWGARPDPPNMPERPCRIYPPPPGWVPKISLAEGLERFWEH